MQGRRKGGEAKKEPAAMTDAAGSFFIIQVVFD